MTSNPWFIVGMMLGVGAGAAAAMLYAPMSGAALIAALRAHLEHAQEDARAAGREAEAEVLARYKQIRSASVPVEALAAGQPGRQSLSPKVP